MAAELKTPLAVALFEAYSRNCGHNPDEHFDRNAAEQWMTQALDECGVAELIEAASKGATMNVVGTSPALYFGPVHARRLRAALARVQGAGA